MIRCKHAKKYKAHFPPRCGCETCKIVWRRANEGGSIADVQRIDAALAAVRKELFRATALHGAMRSPHEGWGVIREEYLEFEEEVMANNTKAAKVEVIQVAATAVRFLVDIV